MVTAVTPATTEVTVRTTTARVVIAAPGIRGMTEIEIEVDLPPLVDTRPGVTAGIATDAMATAEIGIPALEAAMPVGAVTAPAIGMTAGTVAVITAMTEMTVGALDAITRPTTVVAVAGIKVREAATAVATTEPSKPVMNGAPTTNMRTPTIPNRTLKLRVAMATTLPPPPVVKGETSARLCIGAWQSR